MVVLSIELRGGDQRQAQIRRRIQAVLARGPLSLEHFFETMARAGGYSVEDYTYTFLKMVERGEVLHDRQRDHVQLV